MTATIKQMRAEILIGIPNSGKTFFVEQKAKSSNAAYLFYLCHSWTSSEDLFYGVNVVAAVKGDHEAVRQDGVLLQAALLSHHEKVIICIDELDKCIEGVENLFLDFLQYGRCPMSPTEQVQAKTENVEVYFTSNGTRQHTDAFLRRCRRRFMRPLKVEEQIKIIAEQTLLPIGVVKIVMKACRALAQAEGNENLSLNEVRGCCHEIQESSSLTKPMMQECIVGWSVRREMPPISKEIETLLNAAWAEIQKI